jgi:hypothetical protein
MQLGLQDSSWLKAFQTNPIFTRGNKIVASKVILLSFSPTLVAPDANATELDGRTNKICFRGPDIILAVGNEIRITTVTDGAKPDLSSESKAKPYKVSFGCSCV